MTAAAAMITGVRGRVPVDRARAPRPARRRARARASADGDDGALGRRAARRARAGRESALRGAIDGADVRAADGAAGAAASCCSMLDGASLDVISPAVAEGRLPNFGRILDGGAVLHLATLRPTQAEPVWSAAATGARAGRQRRSRVGALPRARQRPGARAAAGLLLRAGARALRLPARDAARLALAAGAPALEHPERRRRARRHHRLAAHASGAAGERLSRQRSVSSR